MKSTIETIYNKLHTNEEKGLVTIGWNRSIYPTRATALEALENKDLFVLESPDHQVVAAARKLYKKLGYWESDIVPCTFNGTEGVQLVCLEKYLNP